MMMPHIAENAALVSSSLVQLNGGITLSVHRKQTRKNEYLFATQSIPLNARHHKTHCSVVKPYAVRHRREYILREHAIPVREEQHRDACLPAFPHVGVLVCKRDRHVEEQQRCAHRCDQTHLCWTTG